KTNSMSPLAQGKIYRVVGDENVRSGRQCRLHDGPIIGILQPGKISWFSNGVINGPKDRRQIANKKVDALARFAKPAPRLALVSAITRRTLGDPLGPFPDELANNPVAPIRPAISQLGRGHDIASTCAKEDRRVDDYPMARTADGQLFCNSGWDPLAAIELLDFFVGWVSFTIQGVQ